MSLGEASTTNTLGTLQDKGAKFTKLSHMEKKKNEDLEDAINFITKETEKYRQMSKSKAIEVMNVHVLTPNPAYSRADGVNIGKEAQMVTTKSLNILEAKLNKLLQKKSSLQNHIKKMKETINHYRLMRIQTDSSHSRFEQSLIEAKAEIEKLLNESTELVEEREKIMEKKVEYEEINQKEQQKFIEEYEFMGQFIRTQNQILESILLEERKHDLKGTTLKNMVPKDTSNLNLDSSMLPSTLGHNEEVEMSNKVSSLNNYMLNEQNSLKELKNKISSYEVMFNQLKKMRAVESIEEMVTSYITHEEEMFSLYNFIQTINSDIDNIQEMTANMEKSIKLFQSNQYDQDIIKKNMIEDLTNRIESLTEVNKKLEKENYIKQELISQLCKKVLSVYQKLQCDADANKKNSANSSATSTSTNNNNNNSNSTSSTNHPSSSSNSKKINIPNNNNSKGGKSATLNNQQASEANIIENLGCIEQKSVVVITEYLRIVNKNKDTILQSATFNSTSATSSNNPNGNSNNNNNDNMNNNSSYAKTLTEIINTGLRSPTPGPRIPVNYSLRKSASTNEIISKLNDDFLTSLENVNSQQPDHFHVGNSNSNTFLTSSMDFPSPTYGSPTNPSNQINTKDLANSTTQGENEDKILDISSFRKKLKKKLELHESHSSPSFFSHK